MRKQMERRLRSNKFNKRYGWIYAASQVAEYERITLDQAFALPIRQAFNDLAVFKSARVNTNTEQFKKKTNGMGYT
jgi:capsule polysaccharide export protein KpsE/RkpR